MKKLIGIVLIFTLMAGMFIAFINYAPEHNPFSKKEEYYVLIGDKYTVEKSKTDKGEEYINYMYTLPGFDKQGNKRDITFNGLKVLRQHAYLKITMRADTVISYNEVQLEDIPSAAKIKVST
ncbi:YxeA family protein [Paenibacillus sp. ACRRX]|uniref:YxeA family protein n=1 Tax=Paenibacillus sp. ACRRX TaxID=2918206 RepID=UPI001EF59162|nr:YxeA family protein [Paenibacillus sp. ACRRX]MCG7408163.1 YxeA family protein [Paenibacillus sp. ACRRX]